MQECKGHLQTIDHKGRDKLEHQEYGRVRGTHRLSHKRDVRIVREQGCKGHSQTINGRETDNLGY
jgi:hypothetical protein